MHIGLMQFLNDLEDSLEVLQKKEGLKISQICRPALKCNNYKVLKIEDEKIVKTCRRC
jgi:hypothetical protein